MQGEVGQYCSKPLPMASFFLIYLRYFRSLSRSSHECTAHVPPPAENEPHPRARQRRSRETQAQLGRLLDDDFDIPLLNRRAGSPHRTHRPQNSGRRPGADFLPAYYEGYVEVVIEESPKLGLEFRAIGAAGRIGKVLQPSAEAG